MNAIVIEHPRNRQPIYLQLCGRAKRQPRSGYRITCLDETGLRVWASRQQFEDLADAADYCRSVAASRQPMINACDGRELTLAAAETLLAE